MRPGEKAILPVWFRVGLVTALIMTLFFAFTNRPVASSQTQAEAQLSIESEQRSVVAQRNLNFIDLEQGAVGVLNAEDGTEILRINKGEDGFMRSVMRGLVRERKSHGIGPDVAFELILWNDGLLSLFDPTTSRRVELSAFGFDNAAAFSRLLPERSNTVSKLWL